MGAPTLPPPPPPPRRNGAPPSSSQDNVTLGAISNRLNDIERQMTQSLLEARQILGEARQIHQLMNDVLNQISQLITATPPGPTTQPQAIPPPGPTTQPQATPPPGLTTQPQATTPGVGLTMERIEAAEAADDAQPGSGSWDHMSEH